jgi:hypothetical protein
VRFYLRPAVPAPTRLLLGHADWVLGAAWLDEQRLVTGAPTCLRGPG